MSLIFLTLYVYNRFFKYRHFKVLKATMRKWVRNPDGNLVTYHIELETKKTSDELVFEELWIDDKKYKIRLCNSSHRLVSSFGKKEIVRLHVYGGEHQVPGADFPLPGKNDAGPAVLTYRVSSRKKNHAIKTFEERLRDLQFRA